MTKLTIYADSDNVIELQSLTNTVTGLVDISATVNYSIISKTGKHVSDGTMDHVIDGTYRATVPPNEEFIVGKSYTVEIVAVGSGGSMRTWQCCGEVVMGCAC